MPIECSDRVFGVTFSDGPRTRRWTLFSKVFSYFFDFSEPSPSSYRVVLNFRNLILENHRRVIGIPTPRKYIAPKSKMISLITHVYSAEWSALIGGIYRLHIYLVSSGRCLSENERRTAER
jgi:hypothetical protein